MKKYLLAIGAVFSILLVTLTIDGMFGYNTEFGPRMLHYTSGIAVLAVSIAFGVFK